jgi:hypothetical protein
LKQFIKTECIRHGVELPLEFARVKVDPSAAYVTSPARQRFVQLQALARARGGKCLSNAYITSQTPLAWCCEAGHMWETTPNEIRNGTWCPYCAGKRKTIETMRLLAASKGGKCLSTEYKGGRTKLTWQCAEGHQWEAGPESITSGKWCPRCGRTRAGTKRKLTIEAMKQLATKRGGKCLSEKYVNFSTALQWECVAGHQWLAPPSSVRKGSWCSECARVEGGLQRRLTIDEMQTLALRQGGKCLSERYVSARTNLLWECALGHKWQATPTSIKRGSWCRICSHEQRAKQTRLPIQTMMERAKQRGGRCLSDRYVNAKTKLTWECSAGHRWQATPDNIQQGKWCRICATRKHC